MIALVTVWFNEEGTEDVVLEAPVWLVVAETSNYSPNGHDVLGQPLLGVVDRLLTYIDPDDGDQFDIVPEDEWPDKVCVALAKRALLSGDNK